MKRPLVYIFNFENFLKFDKKKRRTRIRKYASSFKKDVFEYAKQYVNAANFFAYLSKKYQGTEDWITVDIDEEMGEFKETNEELKREFMKE